MCVITISRGLFSGGQELAQEVARRLGYRCIGQKELLQKAAERGVPLEYLREALEKPPAALDKLGNQRRRSLLALLEWVLKCEVQDGSVVYHGAAGHLLLRGLPRVFHVRVLAPFESRVEAARDRVRFTHSEAAAYIRKADRERQRWTRGLYGVEWGDPSLYDVTVNLEEVQLEDAVEMIATLAEQKRYQPAGEARPWIDGSVPVSCESAALAGSAGNYGRLPLAARQMES